MNVASKIIGICIIACLVFIGGFWAGYSTTAGQSSRAIDRAKELALQARAISGQLADRLAESQKLIDAIRRRNREAIDSLERGASRIDEIANIIERCLEIVGEIEKLLDPPGVN